MRRAPFVAGATAIGLVGILTFRSQSATSTILAAPVQTNGRSNASPPTTAAPPAKQPTSTSTSAPTSASTPSPTSASTPPATVRAAVGPSEQYGYGTLAVKVTVTGNKITDVATVGLQTADQYSQQLATQVIPMLRSEVLHAQSTKIYGISGASYTAQAYVTSLQAALNQLHVK